MRLHFKLINGEEQEFSTDKTSFTIGRSSQSDIVIPHEGMSRKHCYIENIGGKLFVTDLSSINGVFLDDKRIQPDTPTALPMYLNLSFGAVQSLQIDLEENTRAMLRAKKVGTSPGTPIATTATTTAASNSTTTNTVSIPRKIKKMKVEKVAVASKKKETNLSAKNIFMLALTLTFIASVTFYFIREKMQENEPMTPEEMYE